jgi:hypothetical protein
MKISQNKMNILKIFLIEVENYSKIKVSRHFLSFIYEFKIILN